MERIGTNPFRLPYEPQELTRSDIRDLIISICAIQTIKHLYIYNLATQFFSQPVDIRLMHIAA